VSRSIASAGENDSQLIPVPADAPAGAVAYGETDVGCVRESNQDSFAVVRHLGLFMVADGMGGAAGGEVASRTTIEHVQRAVEDGETTWPIDTSIRGPESGPRRFIAGIHRANRQVYKMAREDWTRRGMGTTFVGLLLLARCAVIAHVGDSRVYRLRSGVLERLTSDHSLANHLVERGYLKPEEVATYPRRNVITRAVGTRETVEVDARIVDIRPGDTFLLCSDGLHADVPDQAIAEILQQPGLPTTIVGRLIDRALEAGGSDNVTALLVRLDGDAPEKEAASSTPAPPRST
jgi:serine/threonine protein phosphatase PrpC